MSIHDYWENLFNTYKKENYTNIKQCINNNKSNNMMCETGIDQNHNKSYLYIYKNNGKPKIQLNIANQKPGIDIYFAKDMLKDYDTEETRIKFLNKLENCETTKGKFGKYDDNKNGKKSFRLKYTCDLQITDSNYSEGIKWQLKELNEMLPLLLGENGIFNKDELYVQESNTEIENTGNGEERFMTIKEKINKSLKNHKQIVLTGAPGTSKTFSVREYVEEQISGNEKRFKFVQFHSSYDYTDFVEGLRPIPSPDSNQNMFVRLDGIFKKFCRNAFEDYLRFIFRDFNSKSDNEKYTLIEELYNYKKKLLKDNKEKPSRKLEENLNKNVDLDGFKDKYYFVIDEINRADLSKVFGELMFGLDEAYRGIENRFETQYSNLDTYHKEGNDFKNMSFDCFKNGFFIPENVIIIGTMNDIDRSVESFDFALRRRFQWIEIKANDAIDEKLESMLQENEKNDILKLKQLAKDINYIISDNKYKMGLNDAYHLGPSYFKDYNGSNIQDIYESKILPILKEYTRGHNNELFFNDIENLINNFDNNDNNNNDIDTNMTK